MMRDRVKELRRVRACELRGAPHNWRVHGAEQRCAFAECLEDLGFFSPLEVRVLPDGSLELIDGHLRQEVISADVGPDTLIPVVVTDLSEDEAKKANLVKDPLAAMASADAQALASLMADVGAVEGSLGCMLDELAAQAGVEGTDGTLTRVSVEEKPPSMTWVLIGVETVRFGEIAELVESVAGVPGVLCEVTANDDHGPEKQQEQQQQEGRA